MDHCSSQVILALTVPIPAEASYNPSDDPTTNKLSSTFVSGNDRYSLL